MWLFEDGKMVVAMNFREQIQVEIIVMIWKLPTVWQVWIRDALQEILDCWNRFFDVTEDMVIDFCFYVSPFPSTMLTARQPHAAALPLKSYFRLSTPWTSVGSASLSLSLAKGRSIIDSLPKPRSQKTQQPRTHQISLQQANPKSPITNQHNFNKEEGDALLFIDQ